MFSIFYLVIFASCLVFGRWNPCSPCYFSFCVDS